MKTLRQFLLRGRLTMVGIFLLVCLSSFKVLDPASENELLRRIADLLDGKGIDVMLDWTSNASTEGRPVLAPLANYTLPNESNIAMFQETWVNQFEGWVKAFDHGDIEIMLAAPDAGTVSVFKEEWDKAVPEKRIFLSFAREDAEVAASVREIFKQDGYSVFTFLTGSETELDPRRIAYYMATSGNRLVLDTDQARLKSGVLAESLAESKYKFATNAKLAARIDEFKKAIETNNYDQIFNSWKETYYYLSDEEIEKKLSDAGFDRSLSSKEYQSARSSILSELSREQTSGRVQVEIILKILDAICPYYGIPKIVCPICSRTMLLK